MGTLKEAITSTCSRRVRNIGTSLFGSGCEGGEVVEEREEERVAGLSRHAHKNVQQAGISEGRSVALAVAVGNGHLCWWEPFLLH